MEDEVKRLYSLLTTFTSTSKNYQIIKQGKGNLDSIAMFAFTLFQDGKITKDDYHNMVVVLMSTKNCFDLLENKLVNQLPPKLDKFED